MQFRFFRKSAQRATSVAAVGRAAHCEPLEGRRLLASTSGIRAFIPATPSHDDIHDGEGDPTGGGRLLKRRASVTPAATPNLTMTGLYVVDANNTIASPVTGQMVFARAQYNVTGLTNGTQYLIRFAMDGVQVDSGTVTHNGDGSYYWYRGGWFASPGAHTLTATVDGAGVIAETSETDNTASTTFSPSNPTTLPAKMIQPIGRVRNQDWFINGYADVDPRSGTTADYLGGPYQYDGHDAIDAGPIGFAAQDNGISIHAALAGTVVEVLDGYFDRETTGGSRPGNHVLIDHGNGWQTLYYHFAANSIAVKIGDTVAAGQVIGLMGSSGISSGTHLHFTLIKGGAVIETGYALSSYWVDPPPYAGTAPTVTTDAWTTNYNDFNEYNERESTIDTFGTGSPIDVTYASITRNIKNGDVLTIQFLRPNGTVAQTSNYTVGSDNGVFYLYWSLPYATWSTVTGAWTAVLKRNGQDLNRKIFNIITGAGRPEAKLMQGTTPVLDGRTTAFDLGTAAVGATANTLSFTLSNHGQAPLAISGVALPPGVQVVTALPSTLAVGASATLAISMNTAVPGPRSGEVAILSNDDDEARYSFNVSGAVTGTPAVAAEAVQTGSPAGVGFRVGQAAKIVDPTMTLVAGLGGNYNGATLVAGLYGGGVSAGDGLQILPGQLISVDGANVRYHNGIVGTLASSAAGLSVTFNGNASGTEVGAVARRIAYASTATTTGRRYVRFSVTRPTDVAFGAIVTKTIDYDMLPRPTVTSVTDVFATGQGVKAVFSSDISNSLSVADFVLTNAATGATVAATPTIVTDSFSRTVTLTFRTPANKLLPDGRYAVRLTAAGVTNAIGLPLHEDTLLPFFIFAGDIDHDAGVSINDFNAFAGNFGKSTGQTWLTGDFDGDGGVSIDDFNLLAGNFGKMI